MYRTIFDVQNVKILFELLLYLPQENTPPPSQLGTPGIGSEFKYLQFLIKLKDKPHSKIVLHNDYSLKRLSQGQRKTVTIHRKNT